MTIKKSKLGGQIRDNQKIIDIGLSVLTPDVHGFISDFNLVDKDLWVVVLNQIERIDGAVAFGIKRYIGYYEFR